MRYQTIIKVNGCCHDVLENEMNHRQNHRKQLYLIEHNLFLQGSTKERVFKVTHPCENYTNIAAIIDDKHLLTLDIETRELE